PLQQGDLVGIPAFPAQQIDGAPSRGGHQPCAGPVRYAVLGPRLESGEEAVLDDFLSEVEVADDPDQGAGEPSRFLSEDGTERCICGCPCLGQALIVPQPAIPRRDRPATTWPSRAPRRDP